MSDRLEAAARMAVADQEGRHQRRSLHRQRRHLLRQRQARNASFFLGAVKMHKMISCAGNK